ncbi:hypothetical protein M5C99_20285 [Acidovorax sp. NCPPB 2350]|nr:hypothetical protein M5C99_20285 [Acidovorax sp. NCPPB 2350]
MTRKHGHRPLAGLLALLSTAALPVQASSPSEAQAAERLRTTGNAGHTLPMAGSPLQKIVIRTNQAQSAHGSDVDCAGMGIDAARVRHFWANAIEGTAQEYRHGIDLADCEAHAQVHFRSGGKGQLSLDDATGWGALEQRGRTRYFYCPSCEGILGQKFKPGAGPQPR